MELLSSVSRVSAADTGHNLEVEVEKGGVGFLSHTHTLHLGPAVDKSNFLI